MKEKRVSDIMAISPITLGRNDTLEQALDLMEEHGIRHIPVTENKKLVGILSQRDLYHATLGSVMKYGERAEHAFLASVLVKEVMIEAPIMTISPATPAWEAARQMAEGKVGCLPVMQNEKLVGLVTKTDLLCAFAETKGEDE
jgi:CBS domain-containing protein